MNDLIDAIATRSDAQQADAWTTYRETLMADPALVRSPAETAALAARMADAMRLLDITTETLHEHVAAIARWRELNRKAGDVHSLRSRALHLREALSVARQHHKAEQERIDLELETARRAVGQVERERDAAVAAEEEADRLGESLIFLIGHADDRSPYHADGRRRLLEDLAEADAEWRRRGPDVTRDVRVRVEWLVSQLRLGLPTETFAAETSRLKLKRDEPFSY